MILIIRRLWVFMKADRSVSLYLCLFARAHVCMCLFVCVHAATQQQALVCFCHSGAAAFVAAIGLLVA